MKTSYEKSDFLSRLLFLRINSKEIKKEGLCTQIKNNSTYLDPNIIYIIYVRIPKYLSFVSYLMEKQKRNSYIVIYFPVALIFTLL